MAATVSRVHLAAAGSSLGKENICLLPLGKERSPAMGYSILRQSLASADSRASLSDCEAQHGAPKPVNLSSVAQH